MENNVLHLGPEWEEKKPSKLWRILSFLLVSMIFTGLIWLNNDLESGLMESETQLASLVDEIGEIRNESFSLSQQVESQETILRLIGDDFTSLETILSKGENANEFTGLFEDFSQDFAKLEALKSDDSLELSSVEQDDTIDILLLGTNGSHTDTIMVMSIYEPKQQISLFSIPRDLYINGRRINAYYTYYGVDQLARMVESVTGLKIDNYAQVDLNGFVQGVDILGGLDLYVDKAIQDGSYPNSNGGYDPYVIDVGHYHMDGADALKYARSRKSTTDFDRAARQQKIVYAVKNKLQQVDLVTDMKSLSQLFQTALSFSTTDLTLLDLVSHFHDYNDFVLNTGLVISNRNYLYSTINVSGAYILLPTGGSFAQIHSAVYELVH